MKRTINKRGYLPVELPFYEKLNWDMNLIISCLDVFRTKLPIWFKYFPTSTEFDLISFENPFGSAYPAIGIRCSREEDFDLLPSFIDLYDELETKMSDDMIEKVIDEAKGIDSITWEKLKNIKVYTEPVKHK